MSLHYYFEYPFEKSIMYCHQINETCFNVNTNSVALDKKNDRIYFMIPSLAYGEVRKYKLLVIERSVSSCLC